MARYLHRLSAVLFYALGSSCFLAYVLLRNGIGGALPGQWLLHVDLPLVAVGLLYGGISVAFSLSDDPTPSRRLCIAVAAPLAALFLAFLVLNFWNVLFA